MGRLKHASGRWLERDDERVTCLVSEVFVGSGEVENEEGEGVGYGGCLMSQEEIELLVCRALWKMKNGSASGTNEIDHRLIKAVRDTRLGRELVQEMVDNLARGVILPAWREISVVFIPKPGRDLTLSKNWQPLNLIICVGKLWKKVVVVRIQDFGGDIFHRLQFGTVRGRLVVDVLYRSVIRPRECFEDGGSMGWGFWDLKGRFQNVVVEEVLDCLGGVEGTRGLCRLMKQFVAGRTFEVSWDEKVRGVGTSSKGVPQGSPVSPVLFLVCMALILREIERRVFEEVPGIGVEFPSDLDDLHYGLYVRRKSVGGLDAVGRKEWMDLLLDRVSRTIKEVVGE